MRKMYLLIASMLVVAGLAGFASVRAQGGDSARVYVAVIDKGGKPIKALGPADFAVAEDGQPKTVISAEPAADPLSVALLIDRFGQDPTYSILAVRGALENIVKALHAANADTEISVTTIDPAAVPQVPFTMSAVTVTNFIRKLAPGVDQEVLLDGIISAAQSMSGARGPRRAIVGVIAGYKADFGGDNMQVMSKALQQSRASLWLLEGRSSFGGGFSSVSRDAIMSQFVPTSGGASLSVAIGTALETQAKRLAETLASQYAVTYTAPKSGASTLAVSVQVKNAKVMAPTWIAR
jgi:hypothetical protein